MFRISGFFETSEFIPHGFCLTWRPDVFWTQIVSDSVIAISYFLIPCVLLYFYYRQTKVRFGWLLVLFGLFIVLCGLTHALDIWTLWFPDYGVQALVKAVTALVSAGTAVILWVIVPRAMALPSARDLELKNAELGVFREAIALSFDSILFVEPQTGRIQDVNLTACWKFGYSREEFLRLRVTDIDATIPDEGSWRMVLTDLTAEGGVLVSGQARRKDGAFFPVETGVRNVRIGEQVVVVMVMRDIADRLTSEAALQHAHKMEALGSFTAGAAHEINNMLLPVLSLVGLTIKELPPEGRARLRLQKVLEAAERARDLVNRMMVFARRQQEVTRERIEVATAVAAALDLVRPQVPESIALAAEVDRPPGPSWPTPRTSAPCWQIWFPTPSTPSRAGRAASTSRFGGSTPTPPSSSASPACGWDAMSASRCPIPARAWMPPRWSGSSIPSSLPRRSAPAPASASPSSTASSPAATGPSP